MGEGTIQFVTASTDSWVGGIMCYFWEGMGILAPITPPWLWGVGVSPTAPCIYDLYLHYTIQDSSNLWSRESRYDLGRDIEGSKELDVFYFLVGN